MKLPLFSIRDKLAGFTYPTIDTSEATAKRNFAVAINNSDPNSMTFSPQDYDLYKIGFFDTEKGVLTGTDSGVPEFIVNGATLVAERK